MDSLLSTFPEPVFWQIAQVICQKKKNSLTNLILQKHKKHYCKSLLISYVKHLSPGQLTRKQNSILRLKFPEMLLEQGESSYIRPSLSIAHVSRQNHCIALNQAPHTMNKALNVGLTSSLPPGILVTHIYLSPVLQSHSLRWKGATEFNVLSPEIWSRFQ